MRDKHAADPYDLAYPDNSGEEGMTVWQAYKMAAISSVAHNPGNVRLTDYPEEVVEAAEAIADAAVAGDQERNEEA